MMTIWRIENQKTMHGMWYELSGEYNPFIFTLTEGISKNLPMDYNKRYHKDGKKWFSGCNNFEDMRSWFSIKDAYELKRAGYELYEFEATECVVEDNQVLFTREGLKSQKMIPIETIW